MFTFKKIKWKLLNDIHEEWFLVIDDEALLNEYLKFKSKDLVADYMHLVQKAKKGIQFHNTNMQQTAMEITFGCRPQKNLMEDMKLLDDTFLSSYITIFNDRGTIYICKNTCIRPLRDEDIVEVVRVVKSRNVTFPSNTYTVEDISVTQWVRGRHWYARIGGIDVEIEGVRRWHTYRVAYDNAKEYLKQLNKEQE